MDGRSFTDYDIYCQRKFAGSYYVQHSHACGIQGLRSFGGFKRICVREFLDTLLPSAREMVTSEDGKIDGLPQEGCNWALFYRKDLFEEAGLDPEKPPKTFEEFLEYAKALTKDTDGDGLSTSMDTHGLYRQKMLRITG